MPCSPHSIEGPMSHTLAEKILLAHTDADVARTLEVFEESLTAVAGTSH